MGLLDDTASIMSGHTSHSKHHHRAHKSKSLSHGPRSRSRSRARTLAASVLGIGSDEDRHREGKTGPASASFFGLGGNESRASFFGFGSRRSPSYYKRSPRASFVQRTLKKIRKLLRDLARYAKKHPMRALVLVIVPLVTTGALGALLARFGLRLPRGLEAVLGLAARAGVGGGAGLVGEAVRVASGHQGGAGSGHSRATVERGRDGDWQWEHRRQESDDYAGWGEGGSDWGTGLVKRAANMFL